MSSNDALNSLLAIGASIEPGGPGSSWGEYGRKMKPPEKCQLPALIQIDGDREWQSKLGQLQRRKQQCTWVIMQSLGKDQSIIPAEGSFDLIDLIEAKFGDKGIAFESLGGKVYAAFIDGTIRRFAGDIDGIEMITIPISLLIP